VFFATRMEIGEAPPAADEASQFRGSGTIGTPNGRGNRNAATVTAAKNGSRLFAVCGRLGQPLAALPLYGCRIPLAGKSLRRCFAPQGRGVRRGRTGEFLNRMSRCCFDNFNTSRLRARNVGGCVIYFENSEMILPKFPAGNWK